MLTLRSATKKLLPSSGLELVIHNLDIDKYMTIRLTLGDGFLQAWHFYHNTSVEYTGIITPPAGYKMVILNGGYGEFMSSFSVEVSTDLGSRDLVILLVK